MVGEALHDAVEIVGCSNFQASATSLETLCLLEALVVGSEDDGYVPYGSLYRAVDSYAKSSSDVGDVSIVVDAAK